MIDHQHVLITTALCRKVSLLPWLQAQACTEKLLPKLYESLNGSPIIQYTYHVYIEIVFPPLKICILRCATKLQKIESNA